MRITFTIDGHDFIEDNYIRVTRVELATSRQLNEYELPAVMSKAEDFMETDLESIKDKYAQSLPRYGGSVAGDIIVSYDIVHTYTKKCWKDDIEHDIQHIRVEDK